MQNLKIFYKYFYLYFLGSISTSGKYVKFQIIHTLITVLVQPSHRILSEDTYFAFGETLESFLLERHGYGQA